jgi:hypothetical protein
MDPTQGYQSTIYAAALEATSFILGFFEKRQGCGYLVIPSNEIIIDVIMIILHIQGSEKFKRTRIQIKRNTGHVRKTVAKRSR